MACSYEDIDVRKCKECSNCRTCPIMKIYLELIDIKDVLEKLLDAQRKGRSY